VEAEVGRRIHRVIAELVDRPEPVDAATVMATVAALWRRDPVGGSVASSARLRCSTSVAVYFNRFLPDATWEFAGCEVRLGRAVADLVWRRPADGTVVVDELKSGAVDVTDRRVADQLGRLASGGRARWAGRFAGVRLVPLGSPARTAMLDGYGRNVPVPAGMVPR